MNKFIILVMINAIGATNAYAYGPNAYVKDGQICVKVTKRQYESCRDPKDAEEYNSVVEKRKEEEKRKKAIEEISPTSSGTNCSSQYNAYFREKLAEAISGGSEVWGFSGYSSPNEYASARANVYINKLRKIGGC